MKCTFHRCLRIHICKQLRRTHAKLCASLFWTHGHYIVNALVRAGTMWARTHTLYARLSAKKCASYADAPTRHTVIFVNSWAQHRHHKCPMSLAVSTAGVNLVTYKFYPCNTNQCSILYECITSSLRMWLPFPHRLVHTRAHKWFDCGPESCAMRNEVTVHYVYHHVQCCWWVSTRAYELCDTLNVHPCRNAS